MNVLKLHGELHEKIVLKLHERVIYIHVPFHKPLHYKNKWKDFVYL